MSRDADIRHSSVVVDDGSLHCASAGGGRAVLFLHGWTLDHRMWAPQLAAFAGDNLVIAPDRRGFGRSSAPPSLAREPDDVIRLLDAFNVARAVIIGMSQAGRVALDLAAHNPERVSGLVLHGAPLPRRHGPLKASLVAEYTALAKAGALDEMKRRWRRHALMRLANPAAAAPVEAMLSSYEGRDLLAPPAPLPALTGRELGQIETPTLVITGAGDTRWRRRSADALARAIPPARRIEIADAGHLCNLCRPESYNSALKDFLSSCTV